MRTLFFLLVIIISVQNSFGQRDKAAQIYEDLGYKAAIPFFENKEELSADDIIKIANSYRLNHDVVNAELWYAQVVEQTPEPIYFLYYAQALHSNKKYELAKAYYQKYQDSMGEVGFDQRGAQLANAIEQLHQFKHTDAIIKNESSINTDKLEFSPSFFKDGIVFVSTIDPKYRKKKDKVKEVNKNLDFWINDNFMTLYFASKGDNDLLEEAELFSGNLSTKYHEGPLSFDAAGERIFFSRNQYLKGKKKTDKKGILKMNIYSAIKMGDEWVEEKEFPWNTQAHEEVHPSLSADSKRLYFASDRPEGYGGMDLYYTDFQEGTWQYPVNLGPTVNTPGNELFPFIHQDGTLYFASDSWGGLGGLDIFSTKLIENNQWQQPTNIGTPFNSPKDDFGFILNKEGTAGYLSSAREGGKGKDDIYSFSIKKEDNLAQQSTKVTVCVFDQVSAKRIEGAAVFIEIQNDDGNQSQDFSMRLVETEIENEYLLKLTGDSNTAMGEDLQRITDEKGEIDLALQPQQSYLFTVKKAGYQIAEYSLSAAALATQKNIDFCIPILQRNCMNLRGKVINEKYGHSVPNVEVQLIDFCTGEEQVTFSDAEGNYSFPCLTCGCEFLAIGKKQYFRTTKKEVSTLSDICGTVEWLQADLYLNLGEDESEPTTTVSQVTQAEYQPIDLVVGNTIELKNIYYDFDKYFIREGSAESLDWVVTLMNKYPSLEIELTSHTDARGGTRYNKWLSRKRAKAARQYLIDRGIEPERLQAKGYGEMQIRNHCYDGIDCTEAEHQYNRRTELSVVAFDREDVQVYYLDNEPEKIDEAPLRRRRK